jgi:hypothetical protein
VCTATGPLRRARVLGRIERLQQNRLGLQAVFGCGLWVVVVLAAAALDLRFVLRVAHSHPHELVAS